MRVKIRGGTVQHGEPPLCVSCRHSVEIKGARLDQQIVVCKELPYQRRVVAFPVTSCTGYSDRSQPSLWDMEEIAWVLRSDATRNRVGFVHAQRLEDEERHVIEED
jgi:hypothetical protein